MNKKLPTAVSTLILAVIFFVGLSLLLYPTVSDYWNSLHQTRAISNYAEAVASISEEDYAEYLAQAQAYNAGILDRANRYALTDEERAEYESLLDVGDNGIMGYIEIPSIGCSLPIYHGTNEAVLQIAVGHLEWTSLPVGGESTHCVLSGHRGLPSAKLFTNLDQLVVGDIFVLRVLNETLTYEVDQIITVLPEETSALQITQGEDYCTLVTCTPYGINTHRLLVRGHRVENAEEAEEIRITADAIQIEPVLAAPVMGIPLLILLLVWLAVTDHIHKKR